MSTITTEQPLAEIKSIPLIGVRNRRAQMRLLMLLADVGGFAMAAGLILLLNAFLKLFLLNVEDFKYLLVPVFCLVLFLSSDLYPGIGINPAEEIKLVTEYTAIAFVAGWVVLGWAEPGRLPKHAAFIILWVLAVPGILLARWSVRIAAVKLGLWGEPVVVLGGGAGVERTIRYFWERGRLGYIPVLAALDGKEGRPMSIPMPVIEREALLKSDAGRFAREGIQTLLVDVPAISEFFRSDEAKRLFLLFRRIILVSDLDWIDSASMKIHDFEGIVGISTHQGVLTPTDALLKRILDLVVASVTAAVLLPVMVAVAIWIKLDSPGPVFYDQERLAKNRRMTKRPGKHGRKVRIYKFRTMFINSESALRVYLEAQAEARSEWDATQKLHHDPRVTRAGRFLRRCSIDEIPQLINVIKGDMSLVGPRPLPEYHHDLLSENVRDMRDTLRPGMTGMWQVSGRSETGTMGMEIWDAYYVRNWSVWLDMYILLRTAWVVIAKKGAY